MGGSSPSFPWTKNASHSRKGGLYLYFYHNPFILFWRRFALLRVFIYLFPILINYVLGGVFFITAFRFSEAGSPEILITGTTAMWAIIYSLSSLIVGRIVNEKMQVESSSGQDFPGTGFTGVCRLPKSPFAVFMDRPGRSWLRFLLHSVPSFHEEFRE